MLAEVWDWWLQRMGELLPRRLTTAPLPDALIVRPGPNGEDAELFARRGGRLSARGRIALNDTGREGVRLGSIGARNKPVVLQLPQAMLLERAVVLPLAAERDRNQVLRYEMDRLTPFGAEHVFWSAAIERRDRTRGRLHLRLRLVAKNAVQPLATALERIGLTPAFLEAPGPDGAICRIGLGRAATFGDKLRAGAVRAAVCGCVALALIAIALPFVSQWQAERELDARIAALRPRVAEVDLLKRRIAAAASGADAFAAAEARAGDALKVLAAVTDALPDNTYLTGFSLRGRKLNLAGKSASAAGLIATLSAVPILRNPAFTAPVTHDFRGGEMFSIEAELVP
jgi:general secretion pathway protein L